jgi:hypothetical protein
VAEPSAGVDQPGGALIPDHDGQGAWHQPAVVELSHVLDETQHSV